MTTPDKPPRINGRLSPTTLARYYDTKERLGLTAKGSDEACLCTLLDRFDGVVDMTPEEILKLIGYNVDDMSHLTRAEYDARQQELADIEQAMDIEHVDFWDMVRKGLVREARIQNTQASKLDRVDFETLDATGRGRKNRLRGSADLRIHACVAQLMQDNLAATHAMAIVYITRGIVQDATKAHSDYVTAYFTQHAAELEAHHQALGIGSHEAGIRHNRLRARHVRKTSMALTPAT